MTPEKLKKPLSLLRARHKKRLAAGKKNPGYKRHLLALKNLSKLHKAQNPHCEWIFTKGLVDITTKKQLTPQNQSLLLENIKQLSPWRKGPFQLLQHHIDAEWKSDTKWERIRKTLGSLQGKTVLDLGCNNGYFLFPIAKQNPKYVLGLDPVLPYFWQFESVTGFTKPKNTEFLLGGFDDLDVFDGCFDVILCMGILYHHENPMGILEKILKALRPGGLALFESQGVNLPGSYFLFPESRYMNNTGFWFLPTREAHENMIRRSGFQYVETFFETALTQEEQRATDFSNYSALANGFAADNPLLTIEGYPAPWRFYTSARRGRRRF